LNSLLYTSIEAFFASTFDYFLKMLSFLPKSVYFIDLQYTLKSSTTVTTPHDCYYNKVAERSRKSSFSLIVFCC